MLDYFILLKIKNHHWYILYYDDMIRRIESLNVNIKLHKYVIFSRKWQKLLSKANSALMKVIVWEIKGSWEA